MAQQVKAFVAKPDLDSIPETPMVEVGNWLFQAVLWPSHMHDGKHMSLPYVHVH